MSEPYYADDVVTLLAGDALAASRRLPTAGVDCIVTSPPYYRLRNYGCAGQYGDEAMPAQYVARLRALFAELFRVLADDGTAWLVLGDTYVTARMARRWGLPAKNLLGLPWQIALAMQADGWVLRNAVVWHQTATMPEAVTDRLSSRYEHVFLFAKSMPWQGKRDPGDKRRVPAAYWFDLDPIREPHKDSARARAAAHRAAPGSTARAGLGYPATMTPQRMRRSQMYHPGGRNPGDVWELPTGSASGTHAAVFPVELPRRAIAAGCRPGGLVLDPFSGAGTTGQAALALGRRYLGIDINPAFHDLALRRLGRGPKPPLDTI